MRKVIKISLMILSAIALLLIILSALPAILFSVPAVQNAAINRAATFASEYLGARVEVGRITMGLFNRVTVRDFYVEDWDGDTLLYVKRADARFGPLRSLVNRNLVLEEGKRNIVILHGELADKSDVGGRIGRSEAARLPIDYIALGHYHSYSQERLSDRCTAVYCGTPEGRGFDETGEKGVVMLNVDPYEITHSFIKTCERSLHIIPVDVSTLSNQYLVEKEIENATRGIPTGDIVRVVLTGERNIEAELDTDSISTRFMHRHYYFECKDETSIRISPDAFINDKTLKGEFIRGVFADEELSDDEKQKIVLMGLRALHGASID